MILADTSIWIAYFRVGNEALAAALRAVQVRIHPWIVGELAMGDLARRAETLADLARLPAAVVATDAEIRAFVERRRLFGRGIGFVDAALLASAALTSDTRLWTLDHRLRAVAEELGVAH